MFELKVNSVISAMVGADAFAVRHFRRNRGRQMLGLPPKQCLKNDSLAQEPQQDWLSSFLSTVAPVHAVQYVYARSFTTTPFLCFPTHTALTGKNPTRLKNETTAMKTAAPVEKYL